MSSFKLRHVLRLFIGVLVLAPMAQASSGTVCGTIADEEAIVTLQIGGSEVAHWAKGTLGTTEQSFAPDKCFCVSGELVPSVDRDSEIFSSVSEIRGCAEVFAAQGVELPQEGRAQLDPCKYQVNQRGCNALANLYECRWTPPGCRNPYAAPGTFEPCKYQVNQRGCNALANTHDCRWVPGKCSHGF